MKVQLGANGVRVKLDFIYAKLVVGNLAGYF
jgi:hypothetical protein